LISLEEPFHLVQGTLTDVGSVVGSTEDQFWRSVVPRTDVADIRLSRYQNLGRSKVAELENSGCGIQQQVLGLDITMTYPDGVDISKRSQKLAT
jgi:hypothetical protein